MRRRRLARTDQFWRLIATWHRRVKSPQETGQRPPDVLLPEPAREFPDALSRSPFPAGPTPPSWADRLTIWVCPRLAASAQILVGRDLRRDRFPARRSGPRLINPVGFDKARRQPFSGH